MIEELTLKDFRCFSETKITFSPGINLITGGNGSGKTSVIESLYLLGRGRSFRTNYLSDLVKKNKEFSIIFLRGALTEFPLRVGCEIKKSRLQIKINNEVIKKRSLLLDYLPLQIITPTSHELIDHGPSFRRKFIDWGLFHVEQSYRQSWTNFRRVLKQRNQLLRQNQKIQKNWDEEFVRYSHELNKYREQYFEETKPYFEGVQEKLLGETFTAMKLFPGWNSEEGLDKELNRLSHKDKMAGWTSCGPHKADIKFNFSASQRNVLSRGQQKMLVFSLQIAQCLQLQGKTGQTPLLLIDDISSELDTIHLNRLFELINETGLQCVVSSIEHDKINDEYISSVFHVEH